MTVYVVRVYDAQVGRVEAIDELAESEWTVIAMDAEVGRVIVEDEMP